MGLIASKNFKQAWYSGVLSEKPISCIRYFKLGLNGDVGSSGGKSMINFMSFLSLFTFLIVLIEIGSPFAFASVDWRWRIDRLVGCTFVDVVAGGVFFWFSLFGDGTKDPDVVDEFSLSDLLDPELSFDVFPGMLGLSVCRLIPRVLLQGRPPVLRPVRLSRLLVGLTWPLCCPWPPGVCSFLVSFFGKPVVASSLNITC